MTRRSPVDDCHLARLQTNPTDASSSAEYLQALTSDQDRAFELARRKAHLLFRAALHEEKHVTDQYGWPTPEAVERYRWLIAAMAMARRSPGGDAVTALARRGYLVCSCDASLSLFEQLAPVDDRWLLPFGLGLPTRRLPWASIERIASQVDPEQLPLRWVVSAHMSLQIKAHLRKEGVDFD